MRRLAVLLLCAIGSPALLASPAAAQTPTPGPPTVLDGPSGAIQGLSGISVARDGSGGLVYLKQDLFGTPRVFMSRLIAGSFQPPQQLDGQLGGISSQPVIAAGYAGLLLVAFVNGGQLYVVDVPSGSAPPSQPLPLSSQASNPALSMAPFGKAYLAFTAAGAGGHDVRVAYYFGGQWTIIPTPLDAAASNDAGTGTSRPQVAAAGDGVGIVAWGEAGHVYSRRVWGTAPSVVYEQADVPSIGAWAEVSADEPAIAAGGDSSFAAVSFHEVLSNGALQQSRVLHNRLHGSRYEGVRPQDGLSTPDVDGADQPRVAVTEYGRGFATSSRKSSNQVLAMSLYAGSVPGAIQRVDDLANASAPDAVPAPAGVLSNLIAWQHDPGLGGQPDIRMRYASDGSELDPELTLSSAGMGPTDAARGLVAAGDSSGDAVVAWVQGTGSSTRIVTRQLYKGPGSFGAVTRFRYARSVHPILSWTPPRELWGVTYSVTVDGIHVGQTSGTSLRVPVALRNGRHSWQVVASNRASLASASAPGAVWVDTVPPAVSLTLTGTRRAGSFVHVYAAYTDAPAPLPRSEASGIAQVTVSWGDGRSFKIHHGKYHTYRRAGRYLVKVTVKDRAGNATTVTRLIKIGPSGNSQTPTAPKHAKRAVR